MLRGHLDSELGSGLALAHMAPRHSAAGSARV